MFINVVQPCYPSFLIIIRQILYDKRPVATGWLQTICFIDLFICKRKVSYFSCNEISCEKYKKILIELIMILYYRMSQLFIMLKKSNLFPPPA